MTLLALRLKSYQREADQTGERCRGVEAEEEEFITETPRKFIVRELVAALATVSSGLRMLEKKIIFCQL